MDSDSLYSYSMRTCMHRIFQVIKRFLGYYTSTWNENHLLRHSKRRSLKSWSSRTLESERYKLSSSFPLGGVYCWCTLHTISLACCGCIVSWSFLFSHLRMHSSTDIWKSIQSTGTGIAVRSCLFAIVVHFWRWDQSKLHRSIMGHFPAARTSRALASHAFRFPSSSWLIRTNWNRLNLNEWMMR